MCYTVFIFFCIYLSMHYTWFVENKIQVPFMGYIFVSWDNLLWILCMFVWVYDLHEYHIHLRLDFRWTDVDQNEIYKTALSDLTC
jgi:hypothetical protein